MTSRPRKSAVAGVVATLLFHAIIVVVLLMLWLRYSPADLTERTWPPVDSSELLFGGEYVMTGDFPVATPDGAAPDAAASEAAPEAGDAAEADASDDITPPAPAPVLTQEKPSPAKATKAETPPPASKARPSDTTPATPNTAKSTPTQAEIEAARRREQQAREEQAKANVAANMRFGKGQVATGSNNSSSNTAQGGSPGQANGNAATGALSGQPGVSMNGRTLAAWKQPSSAPMGTITIRVTVNRQGAVTEAVYASGTGPAATSQSARQSCVSAARASRFSVDETAPASQTGTITYHFR